jgi:hypothetical protein
MQHSYEALDPTGGFSRVRLFAPLKHRDFRLLWTGMAVSLLGDGIFFVALAWQVYTLSDVPTALAVVGIAMTVPTIAFLLLGGVISDRFDRRRVMLAADVLRGIAVGTIATLSLTGALRLWHVVVLAALYSVGTAFFNPAFDAIVPELLPIESLPQANSLDQFIRPVAMRLAGPALGGLVIAQLGVRFDSGGDAGRVRVRPSPRVAVGDPRQRGRRLPPVHGPDRGARAVRGQERAARRRRRSGPRVRRRRLRIGRLRDRPGPARLTPP